MKSLVILLTVMLLPFSLQAKAEKPREIQWDDLVPITVLFEDPFEKLTDDQLYKLSIVARHREKQERGSKQSKANQTAYDEAMAFLKEENIDIDDLLARRAEITEKRRLAASTPNRELENSNIRLPGYLLPLEFEGKKVTEFLLVPWVGACIHTPPPPPNQIVHVKLSEGYTKGDSMFTPVWVTGRLQIEQGSPELSFIDGAQNIDVNYVIKADIVEPYE